jgi:four helix bundle protein
MSFISNYFIIKTEISKMTSTELQDRLIDFAVLIIGITKEMKEDVTGKTIVNQLVRSGVSTALNYDEANGAESTRDFIHKMQIVLKELRETWVALQIIKRADLIPNTEHLIKAIDECNELISIFVKSITTNKKKSNIGF